MFPEPHGGLELIYLLATFENGAIARCATARRFCVNPRMRGINTEDGFGRSGFGKNVAKPALNIGAYCKRVETLNTTRLCK
jgi:hypothetical protein